MKIPSYKKSKYPVLLVAGLGGLVTVVNLASAQTWTPASEPEAPVYSLWVSVASSADGSKLVAAAKFDQAGNPVGLIHTSTNSGATWTQTSAPSNSWSSVASSADGSKLVAATTEFDQAGNPAGLIYTSTNSGATWTQ